MQALPYVAAAPDAPWKAGWWQDDKTPRRRTTPSPRRSKDKGKGGGKPSKGGHDKGKGKAGGVWKGDAQNPRPPALEQLPSAPAVPALAAPKQQVQEPAPSPMKAQLDTLLGLLSGSSAALPPEAQQMIAALQETNSQSNAKVMHRAVADQAKARQTLARIQTQKATYLQAWHAYVSELAALLETQLAEQAAVMSDFEEKELQWSQAEAQASQQLARMTGASGESTEAGEREMEISEELADTAAEAAARLRQSTEESQASAKQMLAALRDVQQTAAEQVQQSAREGSRTPRRTQTNEQPAGIGQQEAKPQLPAVPPRSKPGTEGKDAKPGAPPGAA